MTENPESVATREHRAIEMLERIAVALEQLLLIEVTKRAGEIEHGATVTQDEREVVHSVKSRCPTVLLSET